MKNNTSEKPSRQAPVTAIAVAAARRWPATLAVWAAVLALGLLAFFGGLGREGFPPINVPIVVVDGTYFVDNEETVDQDVTQPLADRYGEVDGVASVQSIALGNAFAVIVEFEDTFSSDEGAELLSEATAQVSLPPEASAEVRTVDAAKFLDVYDVVISLTGPEGATPEDLEAQAAELATELESDGSIQTAEVRNLLTEGVNPATGVEEVRQTRFVRVAFAETGAYTDAIAIGVVRTESSDLDIIGFSDRLNGLVDSTDVLDDGYDAAVTADFATDIKAQISNLSGNLLTGLIAVAIVSFLLIGWRVSLVAAGFMATVVLAALAALWFFGYSLNTITLFGLILTLGLLVDDAIVIAESIDANRRENDEPIGVVRTAIDRVGSASLAGTLTTVLVFTPMLFVPGIIGEFIRSIPATVIITLVISFLASIIFIPAVAKPVLLQGSGEPGPIVRVEMAIARALGRLAEYPSSHGFKGVAVGVGIVAASLGIIFSSFQIAATLGFNIFPPGDDANALFVNVDFEPGTTLEEAQALTSDVDEIVLETLGEDLIRSQYLTGNERRMIAIVDLVPFNDRSTTAPDYVDQMQSQMDELDGMRILIRPLENGPPVEEFPFAAQIAVDDSTVANAQSLAIDLRDALVGTELEKSGGDPTTIVDAIVSTEDQVFRNDGVRQIEVRAAFSSDDLTNNLDATELLVADLFGADDLEARGLDADAIAFDYGLESDNQEDFASLFSALLIALGLMFLLLVIQFRSIVQPLLIFLAIPFSFFGVFTILSATDNPISFLVTVGFIALIGVVVNNSILLVDAANQARREGLRPGEAIGQAVTRRFRPLVATTITTVAGLLPLALADPFFESLSFTLIGGLVSSTILVLVAFPVFYLAVERVRTPLRNAVRARTGRELI